MSPAAAWSLPQAVAASVMLCWAQEEAVVEVEEEPSLLSLEEAVELARSNPGSLLVQLVAETVVEPSYSSLTPHEVSLPVAVAILPNA